MKSRKRKTIEGLATSIFQYFILIILQLILTPVILKNAGQDVLGAYVILIQIIGYSLLIDIGVSTSFGRYLTQSIENTYPKEEFSEIFNIGRYLFLSINILTSFIVLILAGNISALIVSDVSIARQAYIGLIILAAWGVIKSPLIVYNQGLISTENMAISNIILTVTGIFRLLLSIVVIMLDFALIGLVLANIISEMIGLLTQRYYFIKKFIFLEIKWKTPNLKILKEILLFGFAYWGVNICIVLTTGSDSLIVGTLYGAASASVFYTTKIPSTLVIQVIYKLTDNVSSAINQLIGIGELESLRRAYLNLIRYSLILAIPFAIAVIVYNEWIIDIWTGSHQYAGNLMTISLAMFILTQVLNHINAMIYLGFGKNMHKWMYLSVINGAMTVILAYIYGKHYGFEYIMMIIAVMDIPIMLFLFYSSCVELKLSRNSVFTNAINPAVKISIPLILWVAFVMYSNSYEIKINIIFSIIMFILLWILGMYMYGINSCERSNINKKILNIC